MSTIHMSGRTRALPRRQAEISAVEFVVLTAAWVAAVAGILATSLLLRSFG